MSQKINLLCSKVIFGLLVLLHFHPAKAQNRFQALETALESKQGLLGKDLVMMIYKNDSLLFKKEIGEFNSKTQVPIASCSKWLTAALVMMYVDEGKLKLDDKISDYLPIYESYGKKYITIRNCLSHTTGIQSEPITLLKLFERRKFTSLEEEVNSFAKKEIQYNPGTAFQYSNMGLNIAARILEVISKKPFDVLIKQKLFAPLGMRNTTFANDYGNAVNPSGGAKSTAEDYSKFLIMLLNKGTINGKRILSEEAVASMRAVQTQSEMIKYAPKAASGFNYALGSWVIEEKNGNATALSSPGLFGSWPMIDYCRGYTYIVLVKNLLGEQRANAHLELKKIIDEQLSSTCK